jgi:tetratricopeptide (TPR) repeat protein
MIAARTAAAMRAPASADLPMADGLRALAQSLNLEGRTKDALLLLEHLAALQPGDAETLKQLARALGAEGRTLEAIEALCALKAVTAHTEGLLDEIRAQMPAALECYNARLASGDAAQAEKCAAALVALIPRNTALLDAALSCNLALGRKQEAVKYAATLLTLDPAHAGARAALADTRTVPIDAEREIAHRVAVALATDNNTHSLIRLRDIHDVASLVLCRPLGDRSISQIELLRKSAHDIVVDVPNGSEWEGWAKHYRLAIEALDPSCAFRPTPEGASETEISFAASSGAPLDWSALQATAKRRGAETVFFAAADRAYVDLYARWYIKSILKYADVSCLIVVHVIGGAEHLQSVAASVGVEDERLIFAGDWFDADSVTTRCYDTPPKGLIAKPVAHFQSVRFLRLRSLLQKLNLPVFVSDIDLLLQRGVADLLQRCAHADVVFNENATSMNAGSRLTANLLLLNPTPNADLFLRFLRSYLERALNGSEVTRWIDQFGLLLARHHLLLQASNPRIEYFDTNTDINNVMYKSYQEHPFRFLSLYHGFDTSTLEGNPRVLGEDGLAAGGAQRAKHVAARSPGRL